MNEVLQAMIGRDAHLAVWPGGTANLLAVDVGMPRDPLAVAAVIASGKTCRINVGRARLSGEAAAQEIERKGGDDQQQWKIGRDEARHSLIHRTELWFGGEQRKNPDEHGDVDGVNGGGDRARPTALRYRGGRGQPHRSGQGHYEVESRRVHVGADGPFLKSSD